MDELEKQKRDAMYAWILAKLDDLGAAMDRALGYPSSSLDPAPSPASVVAVSSTPATASDGAQKVFDEMPPHREASTGGVLRVSVSHVLYPVTKEVLHQLFDPYGAEKVQVLTVATHVDVLISFQSCHHVVRAREALHGRYIWDGCCQLDIQQVLEKPMGISTGTPATCSTTCPSHTTSMLTAAASSSATIVDTEPPASCSTKCPSDSNDVAIAATMSTPVAITVVDDSIASGVPEAAIALATEMRAKCSMSVLGVTTGSNGVTTMSPPLLSAFKEVPMPTEFSPKLLAAIKLDNPMPIMCLKICSNHDNGAHLDAAWPVAWEICNLISGVSIHASRPPPGPPWEVAATFCEARGLCSPRPSPSRSPDPWHHIRKPRADISGTFIFDPGIVFLLEYTLNTMSLSEGSPICRKVFDERYKDRVLLLISLWPLSSRGVTVCNGHKLRSPPECQSTTSKVGSCCLLGFLVSSLFLHAFCHPATKEFCPSSYVKGSRILHSWKIVHLECNIVALISCTENSVTRRTPCSGFVLPGSDKLERCLQHGQRLVGNRELHTYCSEEVVDWAFIYSMDSNNRTRLLSCQSSESSPCHIFSIELHMIRFPAESSFQALALRWCFGFVRCSVWMTEKCLQSILIGRGGELVTAIAKIQNVDLRLSYTLILVLRIYCKVLLESVRKEGIDRKSDARDGLKSDAHEDNCPYASLKVHRVTVCRVCNVPTVHEILQIDGDGFKSFWWDRASIKQPQEPRDAMLCCFMVAGRLLEKCLKTQLKGDKIIHVMLLQLPWDPGGGRASAWGQAEFQGEEKVTIVGLRHGLPGWS